MDLTAERDLIFDELGEDAAYTPKGGGASSLIRVILATPVEGVKLFNEEMIDSRPSAFCKTEDLPGVTNNATVAVEGVTYYVSEIRLVDKWKITRLFLSRHQI